MNEDYGRLVCRGVNVQNLKSCCAYLANFLCIFLGRMQSLYAMDLFISGLTGDGLLPVEKVIKAKKPLF